jgi:serine/threonine protein kinase
MSRANSEKRLGAQLVDDYLLIEQIGQGAMATVYRAREVESDREVALKVGLALDPARLERFRREGLITASLSHPNIVRVHGAGVFESRPYLVYQLVDGAQTLAGSLEEWPLRKRIEALRDVAKALGYAHRRGVVHRDVKPDNVLVAPDGTILLADFGLATAETLDRMTRSGVMLGTPLYMAPEHAKTSGKNIQPQSDVYSVGVMLYEALTGEHPFREAGLAAIVDPKQRTFKTPAERERSVSPALSAICMQALARDPQKRFPSGVELAAALEGWLAEGEGKTRRSWPTLLTLAAGLVLGGLISTATESPAPTPALIPAASETPQATTPSDRSPELVAAVAALRAQLARRPLNDPAIPLGLRQLRGKLASESVEDTALADEVISLLLDKECSWEPWGLSSLTALAETGATPTPHSRAETLCESLWAVHTLSRAFGNRELSRAFQALVVLDVDVEGSNHIYDGRVPAVEDGRTPVERYLRSRAILDTHLRRRDPDPVYGQLVELGRNPALGSITRARALCEGSLSVRDPEARLALMEEARRLDPKSATPRMFWALALLWARQGQRGWGELQEAWAAWRAQYGKRQGSYEVEGNRLDLSTRFLLRLDMEPEAMVLYRESAKDPLWVPTGNNARKVAMRHYRTGSFTKELEEWFELGGSAAAFRNSGRPPRRKR